MTKEDEGRIARLLSDDADVSGKAQATSASGTSISA